MIRTGQLHAAAILALAAAAIAAAPASARSRSAADTAADPNHASASSAGQTRRASSGDRRICVRERLSNTRIATRVCKTQREWEAEGGMPGRH